jgi:uncharacterized membrane protein
VIPRRDKRDDDTEARGEPRAPLVATLLVAASIPLLLPERLLPGPRWVFPALILALMTTMLVLDPGRINRRSRELRYVRISILVVLVASTMYATLALTDALIRGAAGITESADLLLRAGALVWTGLTITFGFLYWELDVGGPGERAHVDRHYPDLAFPQDLNRVIAPPGWRPIFVDYLYLALTNNLAFSPTDVMPLAHWAKLAMGVQSIASLAIIGLVIARAVNIFP